MLLTQPNNIRASQEERPSDKVKVRWLAEVKIYGASPIKLLHLIKTKKEIIVSKRYGALGRRGLNSP